MKFKNYIWNFILVVVMYILSNVKIYYMTRGKTNDFNNRNLYGEFKVSKLNPNSNLYFFFFLLYYNL